MFDHDECEKARNFAKQYIHSKCIDDKDIYDEFSTLSQIQLEDMSKTFEELYSDDDEPSFDELSLVIYRLYDKHLISLEVIYCYYLKWQNNRHPHLNPT